MTDKSRIADVLERIDRIRRATAGGRESFLASEVIQDAVIRNLEVIGEAAKSVGPGTRRSHPNVPWREMARFRDLAIREYGRILPDEVWEIVAKDLAQIRRALGQGSPCRPRRPPGGEGRAAPSAEHLPARWAWNLSESPSRGWISAGASPGSPFQPRATDLVPPDLHAQLEASGRTVPRHRLLVTGRNSPPASERLGQ